MGLVDQRLDAAMDGLGHFLVPPNAVIPGRCEASNLRCAIAHRGISIDF
jgi:hypothetical protein